MERMYAHVCTYSRARICLMGTRTQVEPRAGCKELTIRIKIMPTKSLGCCPSALVPMSPTTPIATPAASPLKPPARPEATEGKHRECTWDHDCVFARKTDCSFAKGDDEIKQPLRLGFANVTVILAVHLAVCTAVDCTKPSCGEKQRIKC